MCIWIYDKYSYHLQTASMAEKSCFDMTKLMCQIMRVAVVEWSRSCLQVPIISLNRVRLPATVFSISLYRFFLCFVSFFNTIFPFGIFFLYSYCWPFGQALGSIYILSLSPEFYFGEGISKALDLHTGQAYDKIKTIGCQDIPPLKQLNFFQC